MGLLALRPSDLLTILKMALSIGYRSSVSFLSAIQAAGLLTFTPVGLPPTEHTSLSWTRAPSFLSPSFRPCPVIRDHLRSFRPHRRSIASSDSSRIALHFRPTGVIHV